MNKKVVLTLLILFSLLPLFELFHPGLPMTHDGQDHVARIANFYKNLEEGNLIPRWAPNLNWGYGHPILMFLYPLPSYSVSLFHFFGFSLVDSTKIIFGLSFVLSGVFMYAWIRSFLGLEAGIVASIIYMFAPYRFVDLYVRGALGEHVAFVFPPLVLYFLWKLSKKFSSWNFLGASLSFGFFILSHNAISLMFLPVIFLYSFYLFMESKNKKKLFLSIVSSILVGFSISAFFWVPAFFEGKYTLRNIVTAGTYLTSFVNPSSLIFGPWSYGGNGKLSVQLGIPNILAFVVSPFLIFSLVKKRKNYFFAAGLVLYSLFVIFLMFKESNFLWEKIMILQNFQFTWRFLSIPVFSAAVLGGYLVSTVNKKIKIFIILLVVVLSILLTRGYWHAKNFLNKPQSFFTNVYYGTTDTGESAPIWSVRFMEHPPKEDEEVINGQAEIKEIKRMSTVHVYVINAGENARIRENTLYFPGWEVLIDGKRTNIEFQDPKNRGLITFFVTKGNHKIIIRFQDTKLRLLSDYVSGLSILALILFAIFGGALWRRFQ